MRDENWYIIWELYDGICVMCGGKASCVHELIPRSKNPSGWNTLSNRVPLCNYCHAMVHQTSPSDYLDLLVMKRDILLQSLGKELP